MPDLRFLLKVSRPRFWIYIFGPYIVGLAAAASYAGELNNGGSMIFGLYFLLPANLLVYGINDIFDYETDKLNAKKSEYEVLVTPQRWRSLGIAIFLLNLPFIAVAAMSARNAIFRDVGFHFPVDLLLRAADPCKGNSISRFCLQRTLHFARHLCLIK